METSVLAQEAVSVLVHPTERLMQRLFIVEEKLDNLMLSAPADSSIPMLVQVRNSACKELIRRGDGTGIEAQVAAKANGETVNVLHPIPQCRIRFIAKQDFDRMSETKQRFILSESENNRVF